MKTILGTIVIACGLTLAAASYGKVPAGAPAGSTGVCKDGSYDTGAAKDGACKGHKGVRQWWGSKDPKAAKDAGKQTKSVTKQARSTKSQQAAARPVMPPKTIVANGGPGKVRTNTESKVYHCEGVKSYGKVRVGDCTTQADATAKGSGASRGKAGK
ncbi:MAG TPA: hypothetical protein VH183_12080 [Burkholderiaceae bacterium]|nr:hypothetical protein [Burkholderiaceae bacterium]